MTSKNTKKYVFIQKLGYILRCLAPLGIVITLLSLRIIYSNTNHIRSTGFLSGMLQLLMDHKRKDHIPGL